MTSYRAGRLDEIDDITMAAAPGGPSATTSGSSPSAHNAWTAGGRRRPPHQRARRGGRRQRGALLRPRRPARFELDGEPLDAPAGTFVAVGPGVRRTAFAEEPGQRCSPWADAGEGRQPSGWDIWATAGGLYPEGRYAEAADRGRELAGGEPGATRSWLYNVACCESLARRCGGRSSSTCARRRGHPPRCASTSRADSDFDPIREEPAFRELIG